MKTAYSKCHKGKFHPRFPKKYNGDRNKISYRSGLELSAFKWFDAHRSVISWSSETVVVQYYDSFGRKNRRYIVDIWAKIIGKDGRKQQYLIEIKHSNKLKRPTNTKSNSYKFLHEEYQLNIDKFKYARQYAANNGMKFMILTEKTVQV